jgi:hypothetical protein
MTIQGFSPINLKLIPAYNKALEDHEVNGAAKQASEFFGGTYGAFQTVKAAAVITKTGTVAGVGTLLGCDEGFRSVSRAAGGAMGVMGAIHTVKLAVDVPRSLVDAFGSADKASPQGKDSSAIDSDKAYGAVKKSLEFVESAASTTHVVTKNWVTEIVSKLAGFVLGAMGAVKNAISFFNARKVERIANFNVDLEKFSKPVSKDSATEVEADARPKKLSRDEEIAKIAVESQRLELLELASNISKLFIAVFTLIAIFFQSFLMPKIALLLVGIAGVVFTNTAYFYEENMTGPRIEISNVLVVQNDEAAMTKFDKDESALASEMVKKAEATATAKAAAEAAKAAAGK